MDYYVQSCKTIPLGIERENLARRIIWMDILQRWKQEYGDNGNVELIARLPETTSPYPVTPTIDGSNIVWDVTEGDVSRHGVGECELRYTIGGVVVQSQIWATYTARSLYAEGSTDPPTPPAKAWFDRMEAEIGDLSELTTEDKSSLVAAINELAAKPAGYKPYPVTLTQSGNKWTADHTLAEVKEALAQGYSPYCVYNSWHIPVTGIEDNFVYYTNWIGDQTSAVFVSQSKSGVTVIARNTFGVDRLANLVDSDGGFGGLNTLIATNPRTAVVYNLGGTPSDGQDLSAMTFPALLWGTATDATARTQTFGLTGAGGDQWRAVHKFDSGSVTFEQVGVAQEETTVTFSLTGETSPVNGAYLLSADKTFAECVTAIMDGKRLRALYSAPEAPELNMWFDSTTVMLDYDGEGKPSDSGSIEFFSLQMSDIHDDIDKFDVVYQICFHNNGETDSAELHYTPRPIFTDAAIGRLQNNTIQVADILDRSAGTVTLTVPESSEKYVKVSDDTPLPQDWIGGIVKLKQKYDGRFIFDVQPFKYNELGDYCMMYDAGVVLFIFSPDSDKGPASIDLPAVVVAYDKYDSGDVVCTSPGIWALNDTDNGYSVKSIRYEAKNKIAARYLPNTTSIFPVKLTFNGDTMKYDSDKTYDEIRDAVNAGNLPVCNYPGGGVYGPNDIVCVYNNNVTYPGSTSECVLFTSGNDEYTYEVLIYNDGRVDYSQKNRNPVMTGASDTEYGSPGLVPRPKIRDKNKFLRGDAAWADPPTDYTLGITSATVGQIAKIKAVDTDGKPTAWEPVDMDAEKFPKFTKLLTHTITQDELESSPTAFVWGTAQIPNLNDFNVFVLSIARPDGTQITFSKWVRLKINNTLMGNICGISQGASPNYVITANRLFGVWISGNYYNPKNISVPVLVAPQSSSTYQSNLPASEPVTSIGFTSYIADYGLTAGIVVELWGAK